MTDYYEILGLTKNCSESDIKKSYRKLAREHHPDKVEPKDREEATKKFQEIAEAYEVLSDSEKRSTYDQFGKDGLNGNMPNMNPFDIFSMFNFGNSRPQNHNNNNTIFNLNISLKDAYKGLHKKLKVTKKIIVDRNGEKVDIKNYSNTWKKCDFCKGMGFMMMSKQIAPGFVTQTQKSCDKCEGKGNKMSDEYKLVDDSEIIEFDIPKGVDRNFKVTFKNRGSCSPGNLPGDLLIVVNSEKEEDGFIRQGNDLFYKKEISLADALCGVNFDLKTLDDRKLSISFSDVITPNEKRKIPNEGVNHGNLYIIFEIVFPTKISLNKKEKLRKLL